MSENSSRSANKSYRRPTGSSSRSLVKAKPSTLSSQSSSKIVKHDGGESDIWRASEMGKASEVNRLLKKGANPNELTARKKTPLHYACIGAKLEIVEILIKAGADKRLQDDFGKSALDYCKMFSEESKYDDENFLSTIKKIKRALISAKVVSSSSSSSRTSEVKKGYSSRFGYSSSSSGGAGSKSSSIASKPSSSTSSRHSSIASTSSAGGKTSSTSVLTSRSRNKSRSKEI